MNAPAQPVPQFVPPLLLAGKDYAFVAPDSVAKALWRAREEFAGVAKNSNDSRRAERAYRACLALLPRLRAFLGDLYDSAQSAEH